MSSLYSVEQKIKTAKRLKVLREEKAISHATLSRDLEEKCGLSISKDSLMKYEVDVVNHSSFGATKGMGAETLYCLAKYYNVSTDFILANTDFRSIDPQMQAVCEYLGLSEQSIDSIKNSDKNKDPYYGEIMGYIPPLLKIFNSLCEKGFITDLTQAFGHFLYNVIIINGVRDSGNNLSIEAKERIMLPAIWHLNKEISDAVEQIIEPLQRDLDYPYMGWE